MRIINTIILGLIFQMGVSHAGDTAGHGGDPLRILLAQMKQNASLEILSVTPEKLEKFSSQRIKIWVKENQFALAKDALNSPHQWTEKEQSTCAHTEALSAAPIIFSFPTCRTTLNPKDTVLAGKLLIHESVHHLGIADEEFADGVANEIYSMKDDSFSCRIGEANSFKIVTVDFNQQVGSGYGIDTPSGQYSIRFNNYSGHLYATVFTKFPLKRKGLLSLIGDYGSLVLEGGVLGVSCSRIR